MRLFLALCASALMAVMVAGCVTTTPAHDLNAETVRGLRVERVVVTVDPSANITWPTLAQELIEARKTQGGGATEASADMREMKAAVLSRLNEKARTVLEPPLRSTLSGTKPVIARVTVHRLSIPTTAGVLVGGESAMALSVDFVDARTEASILSYPKTAVSTPGGYKINMGTSGLFSHDPVERMFADLHGKLRPWLMKS